MKQTSALSRFALISMVFVLLVATAFFAGCTQNTANNTPAATTVATTVPVTTTAAPVTNETTAVPTKVVTTATPAPTYTQTEGNLIAYTAASLTGASNSIGTGFTKAYPNHKVIFNLDGTQALKTQVEAGAYADVFISASNSYTNTLKSEGYFVNDSVKTLTTNYIIVILPASNPAKINSLSDLAKPGVKIAMAANTVPVGSATLTVLNNSANSTYTQDWKKSVISNVVTYETSEPGVATKVSLGEVDAGFVYQSTAAAAASGTYKTVSIPKKDNYLQTYTIGILKGSTNKAIAADFEQFMLSDAGQQILADYGFTSP